MMRERPLSHFRRLVPLYDPSPNVERYLYESERFRGEWRRHPVHVAKSLALTGMSAVLAVLAAVRWLEPRYTSWAISAIIVAANLFIGLRVLDWYFIKRYVLTNKRIMLIEGVLFRRVATIALAMVTDLHYVQSPLARLLNYGTFRLETASWRSRLRRIVDLPNPNELYRRLVEQMHDPDAVEARLDKTVTDAVQEVLRGPPPVNYNGWVNVEILSGDRLVEPTEDYRIPMEPNRPYRLVVTISPNRFASVAETLIVARGVDRPDVDFTVEVDGDRPSLRHPGVAVRVSHDGDGRAEFTIDAEATESPPLLWIRVTQQRRTVQNIGLFADTTATRRHE
jgi:membrane protein YdbS with pleckstrin-like domain